MRYVIARSKVGRHIDFDTGPALFQTADEYERLVANPPGGSDEELSRRQQVARDTQLGALRLSQTERGANPATQLQGFPSVTSRCLLRLNRATRMSGGLSESLGIWKENQGLL
mgnify:CR=1 FL=1